MDRSELNISRSEVFANINWTHSHNKVDNKKKKFFFIKRKKANKQREYHEKPRKERRNREGKKRKIMEIFEDKFIKDML